MDYLTFILGIALGFTILIFISVFFKFRKVRKIKMKKKAVKKANKTANA